ncbi:MAG: hypothetical protein ACK5PS_17285 [Desulfopila sp.]
MKDHGNLHLKVQELCDCYATTDPLKEMSKVAGEKDADEAALKWLALAILHGINHNAENISIEQDGDGGVQVTAKYRKTTLPSPGAAIGKKVIDAARAITHIEERKGESVLAFGIRNSSMELQIKAKEKEGRSRVTIDFPD